MDYEIIEDYISNFIFYRVLFLKREFWEDQNLKIILAIKPQDSVSKGENLSFLFLWTENHFKL